jgi:hypothetical protein
VYGKIILSVSQDGGQRGEILTKVRNLWMALAEQRSFLSDAELAKQIEVIGRIHSDLTDPGAPMVH